MCFFSFSSFFFLLFRFGKLAERKAFFEVYKDGTSKKPDFFVFSKLYQKTSTHTCQNLYLMSQLN